MARIVMVFDDDMNKKLEAFSQANAEGMVSEYILGQNSIPHITVYSWKPSIETLCIDKSGINKGDINKGDNINQDIDRIWQKIEGFLPSNLLIDFDGFYQSPRSTKTYIGLRVPLTQHLVDLNKQIHKELGLDQDNGAGVGYFPHVTLGCFYHENFDIAALKFDKELGQESRIPVRFAIAPTSEHGRVVAVHHTQ